MFRLADTGGGGAALPTEDHAAGLSAIGLAAGRRASGRDTGAIAPCDPDSDGLARWTSVPFPRWACVLWHSSSRLGPGRRREFGGEAIYADRPRADGEETLRLRVRLRLLGTHRGGRKGLATQRGFQAPDLPGGANACPPEDCGGSQGYAEFVEAMADPKHKQHKQMQAWVGKAWDATLFSPEEANAALRRLRA